LTKGEKEQAEMVSDGGDPNDLYKTLEIGREATDEEVRKAYKKLALRCHPDKNPDDPKAQDTFKEISRAYAILSDSQKRRAYDDFGVIDDQPSMSSSQHHQTGNGGGPFPFPFPFAGGFEDILASMFMGGSASGGGATFVFGGGGPGGFAHVHGGRRADKVGCEPVAQVVHLSLEDVRKGCTKRVEVDVKERCHACTGTGAIDAACDLVACGSCQGKGSVVTSMFPPFVSEVVCPACDGRGSAVKPGRTCPECKGAASIMKHKVFDVRLPPGIANDHVVQLHGKGHFVPGTYSGNRPATAGDVAMRFRHEVPPGVRVDYATGDVHISVDIDVRDTLCGVARTVSVCGETVSIKLEGYVNPTVPHRIAGMGIPYAVASSSPTSTTAITKCGDLCIEWQVIFPANIPNVTKYNDVLRRIFKLDA
jgi:DnaJ-class molecular chaperone